MHSDVCVCSCIGVRACACVCMRVRACACVCGLRKSASRLRETFYLQKK
jgi:hypothetical protein